jgi:hypothetical protein
VLSEVKSVDWLRLTHFLEARFPELKEKENKNQASGGSALGV